jgi:hypothetical protein
VRAQSEAPYLYYFQPLVNAWVVERADGTDVRLLGAGQITEFGPEAAVTQGEWSPSGEWFAWVAGAWTGPGAVFYSAYMSSADGSQSINFGYDIQSVTTVAWASNADHVLYYTGQGYPIHNYYLYDPAQARMIWSHSSLYFAHRLMGDYLIYWDIEQTSLADFQDSIHILSLTTGESLPLTTGVTDPARYAEHLRHGVLTQTQFDIGNTFNQEVYYTLDLQAATLVEQGIPALPVITPRYTWDPTQTYGLRSVVEPCLKQRSSRTTLNCTHIYAYTRGDDAEQFLMSAEEHSRDTSWNIGTPWMNTTGIAFIALMNGSMYRLNIPAQSAERIPGAESAGAMSWYPVGGVLYAPVVKPDYGIMRFDALTGAELGFVPIPISEDIDRLSMFDEFGLSPDARYLHLGSAMHLVDIANKSLLPIPVTSAATYASRGVAYYDWSMDSQWVITGQPIWFTASTPFPYANQILRPDGSLRRELAVSGNRPTWLPNHAVPHLPQSQTIPPTFAPLLSLRHSAVIQRIGWNNRGDKLAVWVDNNLYIWSFQESQPRIERIIPFALQEIIFDQETVIRWSADDRFMVVIDAVPERVSSLELRYSLVEIETAQVILQSYEPITADLRVEPTQPSVYRANSRLLSAEYFVRAENTGEVIVNETSSAFVTSIAVEGDFRNLAWNESGRYLLVETICTILIWDSEDQRTSILSTDPYCLSYHYTLSADAEWLVGSSPYQQLVLKRPWTPTSAYELNFTSRIVTFTPDSCMLTAAAGEFVTLWNLNALLADDDSTCRSYPSGTFKAES